jgi:hypothetical protein
MPESGEDRDHRFDAELWLHDGDAAWCFVTVPGDVSDDVEARTAGHRRGFGSVRVRVTVGSTTWTTSVFPDRARQAYLLPVKKEVRARESLDVGGRVAVTMSVLPD